MQHILIRWNRSKYTLPGSAVSENIACGATASSDYPISELVPGPLPDETPVDDQDSREKSTG